MDKERNMRNLLKAIQDGGTDKIYKQHIDELIAEQDSLLSLPHVREKSNHTHQFIRYPQKAQKLLQTTGRSVRTWESRFHTSQQCDSGRIYRYADRGIQSGRHGGHHAERHTEPGDRHPSGTDGNGESPHPVPAPQWLETESESQSAIKYHRGRRAGSGTKQTYTRGIHPPKLYPHSGRNRHCRCGSSYILPGPDMEGHHSQQPLPPGTGKAKRRAEDLLVAREN